MSERKDWFRWSTWLLYALWRPCSGCGARWEWTGTRWEQNHGLVGSCPNMIGKQLIPDDSIR